MARNGESRAAAQPSPPQPDIVDPRLQRLYAYWLRERRERALPARTDIDPVELRFVLAYLSLIDVVEGPARFRVRLQGTELEHWVGCDLTGKTLDQWPSQTLAALAQQYLSTAVETGAPFHRLGDEIIDDRVRRYEVLVLPLASDGVTVNMLLSAVVCGDDRPQS